MSYAEDEGYDAYGYDDFITKDEREWKNGFHIDKDGNEYKLCDMTENHLINAIKYFKKQGVDVSLLQKELNKRYNN